MTGSGVGGRALTESRQAEPASEGGGAVTAILVVGRYITVMAVNRRYVTPEVGWLVGLRDYERSS